MSIDDERQAGPLIIGLGQREQIHDKPLDSNDMVAKRASHFSNGRPSVLYLDHVGFLGGAELSLLDMVRSRPESDHVILMSAGPLRAALEATGIGVTTLAASPKLNRCRRESGLLAAMRAIPGVLLLAAKLSKQCRKYDLVWANSQKSFIIGCFAAAVAGRPLIWHMRDILSAEHFSFVNRKVAVTLANRFASKVVTVSHAGMQSFVDSGGRPGLATVVYNGFDSNAFDAIDPAAARAELARELPIANAPLLGSFGRMTAWKGQHILLRALQHLPGVHVLFVGDSTAAESQYLSSLGDLARELGVAERTHFIGFRRDIPQLMSAVDLVVHTSTAPEPFGRVIVEAMLAQKPIIATDGGGAREIITHNVNGILVSPSEPAALAGAIRDLLDDPVHAKSIATKGRQTAIKRFGLLTFLQNIEGVKKEVHGAKAPRRCDDPPSPAGIRSPDAPTV